MNLNDVSQREVLDFDQFKKKVHDNNYKPLSPENQAKSELDRSGLHTIERQPAYDFVGYADAVFAQQSKIDVPGVRVKMGNIEGMADTTGIGSVALGSAGQATHESIDTKFYLRRLEDF